MNYDDAKAALARHLSGRRGDYALDFVELRDEGGSVVATARIATFDGEHSVRDIREQRLRVVPQYASIDSETMDAVLSGVSAALDVLGRSGGYLDAMPRDFFADFIWSDPASVKATILDTEGFASRREREARHAEYRETFAGLPPLPDEVAAHVELACFDEHESEAVWQSVEALVASGSAELATYMARFFEHHHVDMSEHDPLMMIVETFSPDVAVPIFLRALPGLGRGLESARNFCRDHAGVALPLVRNALHAAPPELRGSALFLLIDLADREEKRRALVAAFDDGSSEVRSALRNAGPSIEYEFEDDELVMRRMRELGAL